MNCPSCGLENLGQARFCMECTASLVTVTEAASAYTGLVATLTGFVGRRREMEQLVAALDEARCGRGRLVMVAGEPGIGKTRLAQQLAAIAEESGAQVLWGRCYEDKGTPPYWPWLQVLRSSIQQRTPQRLTEEMAAGAADIAEIVPELREKLPDLELPPSLDPEQARFRLFSSISDFLRNSAISHPLLVVLDDLHWADGTSLQLLEFLTRDITSEHLLLLGTYRDVEVSRRHPLSETLGSVMREQNFLRIQLSGLTRTEVGLLLGEAYQTTPASRLLAVIHQRTEGNPLFVGEIARSLEREGAPASPDLLTSIPEGVRDAIGRRLNRLSDECNRILTVASVIGREFTLDQLRLLIESITEDQLLEFLEEASASRIIEELPRSVGRYQFAHALIQETLNKELSTTRRVRLHATVAESLEGLYGNRAGDHAAELAQHFYESEAVLGNEKLVRYSLLAGEQALSAYAHEEARSHFERGLSSKESQPTDSDTAALLFGLGRAQLAVLERARVGAVDTLTRAFDFYAATGDVEKAVAVADYPFVITASYYLPGMANMIARALELVPPESHQAGRLLSRYGVALGAGPTSYLTAQKAFADALTISQRENDTRLEIRTLANACRLDSIYLQLEKGLEESLRAIELLEGFDDPVSEVPAHRWATAILLSKGDLIGAKAHASATLNPAERARDRTLLAIANWTNAPVALMEGNWEVAHYFVNRGLAIAPQEPQLLGIGALIEYQLGQFDQGEVYMEQMVEFMNQSNPPLDQAWGALAIALVACITGDRSRLQFARKFAEVSLASPAHLPILAITARIGLGFIAVLESDIASAQEQYAAIRETRIGEWTGAMCTDRLLGLLAQTTGDLSQAISHFEDALNFCRNAGYRPELAWTYHDCANLLIQNSKPSSKEKALSLLEEGLTLADELGMRPLVERIALLQERAVAQPTSSPTYPDGLSHREVEVLRLVAAGKNNREIAEELVVSVGTVANHVTSILSKASLNNRTEAAGYAIRQGLA